jgi:hypothetical protein
MSSSISVSQLCNRSTDLHLCGYSEEVLNNLIQNGDLQGYYNQELGDLMVDKNALMNFLPSERKCWSEMEKDDEESLTGLTDFEGML